MRGSIFGINDLELARIGDEGFEVGPGFGHGEFPGMAGGFWDWVLVHGCLRIHSQYTGERKKARKKKTPGA